jgi:hypothetical protein
MKISFVAIVSMVLIFAIVEYQLQYADGIDSSSTICINGKCITKVCPEMNHVELSEITRLAAPKTILLGIGIILRHLFLY